MRVYIYEAGHVGGGGVAELPVGDVAAPLVVGVDEERDHRRSQSPGLDLAARLHVHVAVQACRVVAAHCAVPLLRRQSAKKKERNKIKILPP